VRDEGLLKSALARPQQLQAFGENPDTIELASAYIAGILRNHPFIDGNKRAGFLAGVLFLELNGCRFGATEEEAAQAVLDLASGALDEIGFAEFLRRHSTKPNKGQKKNA